MSVDALKDKYPFYTAYQYAGNKPIVAIDIDGLEGNTNIGQRGIKVNFDQNASNVINIQGMLINLFQSEYGIQITFNNGRMIYTGIVPTRNSVSQTARQLWINQLTIASSHSISFTAGDDNIDIGYNDPIDPGVTDTMIDIGDFDVNLQSIPLLNESYQNVPFRAMNLARVLEHEVLGHGVMQLNDAYDSSKNPENHGYFDGGNMTGNTVDFVNNLRLEMGLPLRTSYYSRRGRVYQGNSGEVQDLQITFSGQNGRGTVITPGNVSLNGTGIVPDWKKGNLTSFQENSKRIKRKKRKDKHDLKRRKRKANTNKNCLDCFK